MLWLLLNELLKDTPRHKQPPPPLTHLSPTSPPPTSHPPTSQGVVFNEMKGVYSSPDQLHYRAVKSALYMQLLGLDCMLTLLAVLTLLALPALPALRAAVACFSTLFF